MRGLYGAPLTQFDRDNILHTRMCLRRKIPPEAQGLGGGLLNPRSNHISKAGYETMTPAKVSIR